MGGEVYSWRKDYARWERKLNILKKIVDRKISAEANVVSILYKKPELFNNTDITRDSFSSNIWRVFL